MKPWTIINSLGYEEQVDSSFEADFSPRLCNLVHGPVNKTVVCKRDHAPLLVWLSIYEWTQVAMIREES